MQPADVALDGEGNFDVQSVVFGAKDFGPPGVFGGIHKITLQFRVDEGTIAQIRDVNLSSRAVRRTGADFDQAQPLQNGLFPAQGRYNLLTICIDRCVRVNRPSQTWSFTALSTATTAASAFAASMKRTPAAGLGWRPHRPRLRNADGVSSAA